MGEVREVDRLPVSRMQGQGADHRDELIEAAEGAVVALSALEDYVTDPVLRPLVRRMREQLERAVAAAVVKRSSA
jgi:hypothetical protein